VEVKKPTQTASCQNNMQKTMDRLKELLLGDNETQEAGKRMNFLKKKSRKLLKSFL
jgi:hypothetical protein